MGIISDIAKKPVGGLNKISNQLQQMFERGNRCIVIKFKKRKGQYFLFLIFWFQATMNSTNLGSWNVKPYGAIVVLKSFLLMRSVYFPAGSSFKEAKLDSFFDLETRILGAFYLTRMIKQKAESLIKGS